MFSSSADRRRGGWPPPLIYRWLALIVVSLVAGSLYWIGRNVTLVGRDAAGHLERSVVANDALASPSLRSLFTAITLTDDYRPPLLYLLTIPFYRLAGTDMDAAQLTNVALLALILILTFILARKVLSDGWALVATLFSGLLPMIAAMTRLYYMENLLTALLLLNLLALLESNGFARRGWSLVWGISLGLALLTKWTTPIYLVAPTLFVLWRDWGLEIRDGRLEIGDWRFWVEWRRLLIAVVLALGLVAVWWGPNRDLAGEFRLGHWLPWLWGVLFAATIYLMLQRPGRVVNFLGATLLATSIASLWYLPQIDFTTRLSDVAFGTDRGTQEALDLTRLSNYTRYFGYWLSHHMGMLATVLILPPALYGWFRQWRAANGRHPTTFAASAIASDLTPLWIALITAFLLLALIAQANPRNLNPLLPLVAILLIASLRLYPRAIGAGLAALWISVLGVQWAIYTFDGLAPLYARTPAWWVHGDYLAWPASGSSDPGFWIQPDVLDTISAESTGDDSEPVTFGMLSDAWELHRGSFRYLIAAQHRPIDLMALTESDSRGWSDLLANQWVLVKTGDNSAVKPAGQQLIGRILAGDPLFDLLYRPVKRYPLPNGEEAILYHRSQGSPHPYNYPVVLIETQPIAETINRFWGAGATLYFGNPDTATWVGIHDLQADRIVMPAPGASAESVLQNVTGTIFAVTRYDTPEVQEWLFPTGYPAVEVGDHEFHLSIVGRPAAPLADLPVDSQWAEVTVTAIRSLATLRPGEVLPVEMSARGLTAGARKLSLRLVDPAGKVVAQQDRTVEPTMRFGLLAPPASPPGAYLLAGLLYDPATLQPIPDAMGVEQSTLTTMTMIQP